METALYFPYIRVPAEPWFTQILLYWDDVSSIIPPSLWDDRKSSLSPYMNELVDTGMLHRASPDEAVSRAGGDVFESFTQGFLNLLESRPRPTLPYTYVQIHTEKLPYLLFLDLQGRGLVQRAGGTDWDESWWFVEKRTANLYMGYLAGAISAMSPGTVPVADRQSSFGRIPTGQAKVQNSSAASQFAQLRYSLIADALPAPRAAVPATELRAFKDEHQEQLRRCRRHIDRGIHQLASLTDEEQKKIALSTLADEIRDQVMVLQEQMIRRRWPQITMVHVGGLVSAVGGAALTVATAGAAVPIIATAIAVGAIGVTGVGYQVAHDNRPQYDKSAPLAYAAMAGGKF